MSIAKGSTVYSDESKLLRLREPLVSPPYCEPSERRVRQGRVDDRNSIESVWAILSGLIKVSTISGATSTDIATTTK